MLRFNVYFVEGDSVRKSDTAIIAHTISMPSFCCLIDGRCKDNEGVYEVTRLELNRSGEYNIYLQNVGFARYSLNYTLIYPEAA